MLGVENGRRFLHPRHPLWEALGGRGEDFVASEIIQDRDTWTEGKHNLVTEQTSDGQKHFVVGGSVSRFVLIHLNTP